MSTLAFDTHAFVKRLTAVGITEEQAEVFADQQTRLMDEMLASKLDIELVRRDMKELDVKLSAQMREMEQRIVIRMGAMMAVSIGVVAAVVRLL